MLQLSIFIFSAFQNVKVVTMVLVARRHVSRIQMIMFVTLRWESVAVFPFSNTVMILFLDFSAFECPNGNNSFSFQETCQHCLDYDVCNFKTGECSHFPVPQ